MRDVEGPPRPGEAGPKVLSIVDRIQQRQLAALRLHSSKTHRRELEMIVNHLDMNKQLQGMDFDAVLAGLARLDTAAARIERGSTRCLRGLQSCLHGNVAAGYAEWAEVVAEVPELALPHVLRARWLVRTDPREALLHYDRAAQVEPRDATTYWRRGDCYAGLGEHERALANYRHALALDPHSIDGLHAMGKTLVALGRLADAIGCYDKAIARAPRYVDFYESRALALAVAGQHEAAVRDYDRALELDPSHVVSRFARARSRADLGDVDRAIEEVTALVAAEPLIFPLHLLLGQLLAKASRFEPAQEALSRAIELAPAEPEAWAERARALVQLGEPARATADFERAAELAPDRLEYVYPAVVLRHRDDEAAKIAALEGPIERFPGTGLFLEQRAEAYAAQGDHERSLADWDRLVASWREEPDYRLGRAKVLAARQCYGEALEEAARAVELAPESAMAYGLRANYREHLAGDDALIAADWARAAELAPDDFGIHLFRGRYLKNKRACEAAVVEFDRVIALLPALGEAYYLRACCRHEIDEEHADDDAWQEEDAAREARYHACVDDLERALELGYGEDDVFIQLFWNHRELDDDAASLGALGRGIEAHPACAYLYRLRMMIRRELKDEEGEAADRARAEELGEKR